MPRHRKQCALDKNFECDCTNHISLSEFPVDSICEVVHTHGCEMCTRLANMGIGTGSILRIIKNDRTGGPLIVLLDSTQYAIGRGMAKNIICKKVLDVII